MKNMHKNLVCITCLLLVTCMFASIGYAAGENEETIHELTIVDGRLSDENIMAVIDEYLNLKIADKDELAVLLPISMYSISSEESVFITDVLNRNEAFDNFETLTGVEFVNVEIGSVVREIILQTEDMVTVNVYETTVIEYYAAEGITVTDVMGYGTDHEITLAVIGGEYQVVSDSYDDRLITGNCSSDMIGTELVADLCISGNLELEENGQEVMSLNYIISDSYNVTAAINYANQWCGVSEAYKNFNVSDGYVGDESTDLYNNDYAQYAGSDCANFVSQCLAAGNFTVPSAYWTGAKALHLYLKSSQYETTPAGNTNVFPGNPVYWWNGVENNLNDRGDADSTGHQMICTGYNSANVPVVNGHTPNMFRVPITGYINCGAEGLHTALIVNENKHDHETSGNVYVITESAHALLCKICKVGFSYTAHIIESGKCSVCGYTGPFALNSILYPEMLQ